ncbi:MAG: SLBB domain-containing protein [Deltaproteobacteria bacterium]|nr:SLBB domain-containing protein [Deltaproteobacteria bacterium]MBI3386130.1 SLBB domain-containing protein [Deltaproteobacteria bacterium]
MNKRRASDAHLVEELRRLADNPAPDHALRDLSHRTQTPLHRLHSLTTFFPQLGSLRAEETRVCGDLSCHLAEPGLLETLRAAGKRVSSSSCLGLCDQPAAVAIGDHVYGGFTSQHAVEAIANVTGAAAITAHSITRFIDPHDGGAHYATLRGFVAAGDPDSIIKELDASGLRGFGGAGFPTARKWQLVRAAHATEKFVVCNADESEPGTFKDRFLLEHYPHLIIEGLVIAALVVGARKAYVFLRHEYARQRERLVAALTAARAANAVGASVCGSECAVDIEIFDSPGGYICGEETALLEAMEGKRAEPRNRPPFPGVIGLWGQPTLINNVETLAWVPTILTRGGAWFAQQGCNGASGLKFIALSGHVTRPGVYEIPLGLTVRELIEEHGGGMSGQRRLKAFAPGGASSGFLPAACSNIALDFQPLAAAGSMLGSGAVIALAEGTCMVDAALSGLRFFRNESCGKCVPCRVGSEKLVGLAEALARGVARAADLDLVRELANTMEATSICGLGQAAPNPLLSVLKHFPDEVDAHLHGHCPARVCR